MFRRKNQESSEKSGNTAEPEVNEKVPSVSYFTLYKFASKLDKLLISIALISSFIAGLSIPYAITLVADAFQNMIDYQSTHTGKTSDDVFLNNMHKFARIYSCIGVLLFLGGYLGSAFMNITAINQALKIRQAYLKAALNQDFSYFDLRQTGDFASKMSDDVIKLEEGIGDKLSALVYNLTVALGCITMALFKGWKLALLCLTTAPISFLLIGVSSKYAQYLTKRETEESGHASSVAEEALSAICTVYSFNGQQKEIERYQQYLTKCRQIQIKKDFFNGLAMGFMFFCLFCSYALSFYLGIYLIIHDPENYNADVMFAVFFGVMNGLVNFGVFGSLLGTFAAAKGAGAHIFYLLNNVPTINPVLDEGIKPTTMEGNVEFRNVVFHYPTRPSETVLKSVNLNMKRGQSVALVGHSGCGKSTIIQLISRYYDVIEGSVLIDGNDVRTLSVCWLRSQIGLVGQEPVLFDATVHQNISYGRESASNAEIEAAARQANAHEFITNLPKGYETLVGERGASLSGGQKQRIAIARAIVRNPRILLLDEATSALDVTSEARVKTALDKAAQGRTTVIVAHRLSTVRNVDVIYVMKKGEIIETGNHEELVKKKGTYFEMLTLQDPHAAEEDNQPVREGPAGKDIEFEDTLAVVPDEKDEKLKEPPLSFWQVVGLNAPEWKSIVVGTCSSVVIGFGMPLFIVAFGEFFGSMSDPDPNKMMEKVTKTSMILIGFGLVIGISNLIEHLAFGIAGAYLTERLRLRMFSQLLHQHVAYFDLPTNSTGALCARLSVEAAYVQGATGQRIGVLLQGIGSIGLALVLAMVYEWRVGLVALSFCPVVAVVVYYQGKAVTQESFGTAKSIENSTKIALEAVSNVRTVASLGREPKVLAAYVAELEPALAPARRSAHLRGVVAGMSHSMFNFINSAALVYGAHLMVSAGVSYENILVTTQSLQMASGQAQNAFTYAPDFQKGINAASRAVVLLNAKPEINDPVNPKITQFIATGKANFTQVEFKYPHRPRVKVLQGLDLQIDSGKTVALVGKSGCGKSTVVKLLERYYDPDSGIVALDGIPIQQLLLNELRANFGLVSQEPVLFDRTIRENIAYGDNSRTPSYDEIVEAAQQANIHNFIVSLPKGYETNIGSKGTQLSGGQKQRVAIARALIRHPKILLLDEATSALDTESEKVVQEALDRASKGRTCVVIAHRLSTIRNADVICFVTEGRVSELGTHDELMNLKGQYYDLHTKGP